MFCDFSFFEFFGTLKHKIVGLKAWQSRVLIVNQKSNRKASTKNKIQKCFNFSIPKIQRYGISNKLTEKKKFLTDSISKTVSLILNFQKKKFATSFEISTHQKMGRKSVHWRSDPRRNRPKIGAFFFVFRSAWYAQNRKEGFF